MTKKEWEELPFKSKNDLGILRKLRDRIVLELQEWIPQDIEDCAGFLFTEDLEQLAQFICPLANADLLGGWFYENQMLTEYDEVEILRQVVTLIHSLEVQRIKEPIICPA